MQKLILIARRFLWSFWWTSLNWRALSCLRKVTAMRIYKIVMTTTGKIWKRTVCTLKKVTNKKEVMSKGRQKMSPFYSTKWNSNNNKEFAITATTQVELIAKTRNLEEIRWTFIGNTTATNRSKAIQTRLSTETVIETFCRNHFSLQNIRPVVPSICHSWEPLANCANCSGRVVNGNIKSDTAMLTIK